jgi:hypothetical protein
MYILQVFHKKNSAQQLTNISFCTLQSAAVCSKMERTEFFGVVSRKVAPFGAKMEEQAWVCNPQGVGGMGQRTVRGLRTLG